MKLFLNIHGLEFALTCADSRVTDEVGRQFAHFVTDGAGTAACMGMTALLRTPDPNLIPRDAEASLITIYSTSYEHDDIVYIDYQRRGLLVYDTVGETAELYSDDVLFLATMATALITSRVRQLLPARGIHVFPWLSVSARGSAFLFLMYPGGGKTTLTLELLRSTDLALLGDTFTFVSRDGTVLPYPRSIHKRGRKVPQIPEEVQTPFTNLIHEPRVSIDLGYIRDRFGPPSRPTAVFLCNRIASEEPRIVEVPKWRAFVLAARQVRMKSRLQGALGHLVPPTRMSRPRSWWNAARRALAATSVLGRSDTYLLLLGHDTSRNVRVVERFIEERARGRRASRGSDGAPVSGVPARSQEA